jgi:hypothetical protein
MIKIIKNLIMLAIPVYLNFYLYQEIKKQNLNEIILIAVLTINGILCFSVIKMLENHIKDYLNFKKKGNKNDIQQ